MKLYHLSYDRIDRFLPRIPAQRIDGEDGTTPRICLSDSLIKCVNARPGKAQAIAVLHGHGVPCTAYLYEFDLDPCGPGIVWPSELKSRHGVIDAVANGEHWLLDAPDPGNIMERAILMHDPILDCDPSYPYPVLDAIEIKSLPRENPLMLQDLCRKISSDALGTETPFCQFVDAMSGEPGFFRIARAYIACKIAI